MTLEDKLLDRLERLAKENHAHLTRCNELVGQVFTLLQSLDEVRVERDQANEAHDQLKARAAELEKKLSRKKGTR